MNKLTYFLLFGLFPTTVCVEAADTPETILIRQSLNNDKFGLRRGADKIEVSLSACAEEFVTYDGNNTADPRGWVVLDEDREAYAQTLATKLNSYRYDIERSVPHIVVLETKAVATTLDSGFVIDRQTGDRTLFKSERVWFFEKFEDEWLATAFVEDYGDTTLGPRHKSIEDPELTELLQDESSGWEESSPNEILEQYDEDFTGLNGVGKFKPASWTVLFVDASDMGEWLSKRLQTARYRVVREILYTTVSKNRKEALAVTLDKVSTSYEAGPVTHELQRYAFWTMTRSGGSWKVTNVLVDLDLPEN